MATHDPIPDGAYATPDLFNDRFDAVKTALSIDAFGTIEEAIAASTAAALPLDLKGTTQKLSAPISAGSNLKIRNGTLDFTDAGAVSCITSTGGSVGPDILLTSNAASGDFEIDVADASSLSAGDYIVVYSDETWNVGATVKVSEIVRILSKSGNTLTLYQQLDYAYTTANNGRVAKITWVEGWEFDNVTIIGDPAGSVSGIDAQYLKDSYFNNVKTHGLTSRALGFRTCWNLDVTNPRFHHADPALSGGLNYGVAFTGGCHHVRVRGAFGENVRHVVTVGGSTWVNRHVQVIGVQAAGGTDAAVDCHAACDHFQVSNVQMHRRKADAACEGVIAQGARVQINNVQVHGGGATAIAVRWQPLIAASVPLSAQISNVQASGECNVVVKVHQISTVPIKSLQISNIGFNPAHGNCQYIVDIDVEQSDLQNFSLANINGAGVENRGIYVHVSNTHTISHGSINGGSIVMESGSGSCIRLQAGASAALTHVYVGGMVLDGGVYGINAPDSTIDFITIGPNVYDNLTTAETNIAGANSKVVAYV